MSDAVKLWDAVWNAVEADRIDDLDDLFAEDVTFRTSSAEGTGRDYAKGVLTRHRQSYPDLNRDVVEMVESGDGQALVVELFFNGTHKGALRHPNGETIEPTGRSLRWRAFDKITVADGRITSWCAMFDRLALLQQLS